MSANHHYNHRRWSDNKLGLPGRKVEPGLEGAEDVDAGVRPLAQDHVPDAPDHVVPDGVLLGLGQHPVEEVLDLFVEPA